MENTEKATFAAGCFWGVEYKFGRRPGVLSTAVGYEGGQLAQPTYKQVCTDRTGHAEVVELRFDPAQTSYEALVRYFFEMHDPTTLNRQGEDVGTQYRSVIFTHSEAQQAVAERVRAELDAGHFAGRIVTRIEPAATFWPAEEYHQKYGEKHPNLACTL
ncbi:peptide-methionine (S)-S-oxide reductase [Stagnimonas aquatica]|uniref:Peptide methionine sulfoxide reductase MsrA n=1 Tax=Stagnimonas aquatica TaxID=2689987 RepID=A0A3N0V0V4_9GAMM|nr:peptide-methionine (S)-S-oxide reductase MsrA [Stagnimonas aquatica]ROH86427.1 peptide-methionine (S)-S-oxide reductase [Stagnimonas aquatica]